MESKPTWVSYEMLAACKQGDRLYDGLFAVFRFPEGKYFNRDTGEWKPSAATESDLIRNKRESYTVPPNREAIG